MATKNIQRKKPGFTKSGAVKLVSLSVAQLTKLLGETSKPKQKAKIQNILLKKAA